MEYYHPKIETFQKYKFSCEKTEMSFRNIQEKINENKHFCREESSIKLSDLTSYITYGISFFIHEEEIKGLVTFTVNVNKITITGLCVPEKYKGNGKILIEAVKSFAVENGITQIKLTCYGDVFNFYLKQGFNIEKRGEIYDSDDEDEVIATSYDMIYIIPSGGRKRKQTKRKKRRIKSKKSRK
jgi:hypothetical protein